MGGFTPSTVPGCRAPHFFLADGRSLYDAFGADYTLLRFDPTRRRRRRCSRAARGARRADDAARRRRRERAPAEYRHALVLCRADQHVAWRGDAVPADPAALIERLRGAVSRGTDQPRSALEHVELPELALAQLEHRTQRTQPGGADALLEVAQLGELRARLLVAGGDSKPFSRIIRMPLARSESSVYSRR